MSGVHALRPFPQITDRRHRVALYLTALMALFFAIRGAGVGMRPQGTDLTIYLDASRAWLAGQSPMGVQGYLYLPSFAALISPLAAIPRPVATVLWAALSLLALIVATRAARQLATPREGAQGARSTSPWLYWAPLACVLRPIDSTFSNGQANLIVLGVMLTALLALRKGNETRAGTWLALGIALKVLPVVFLAYFAIRRRWRALGTTVVVTVTLSWLLPAITLGLDGARRALVQWWQLVLTPHVAGGNQLVGFWGYAPGQSLPAVLVRTFSDTQVGAGMSGAERVNLASLDPILVGRIGLATSTLLVLLVLLPVLLAPRKRPEMGLEMAALCTTAVIVAPLVHKAHMVWLLLGFAVGVQRWWVERTLGLTGRAGLLLAALLISGTAPAMMGRSAATWLVRRNAIFLGALVLLALLLVELWSPVMRRARGRGDVSSSCA